jgi:membrane-bound ClpP family serine protease
MWAIAGVLLGLVLLSSLVGFHAGPHSHVFAGVLGAATAIWLAVMALTGQAEPMLWLLLSADVVVTAGVGTAAYKGLKSERTLGRANSASSLAGAEGVAVSALDPDGLVRVRGETWSATSMNGTIAVGGKVQVIEADRVRLQVWGEDGELLGPPKLLEEFYLDEVDPPGAASRTPGAEPTGADHSAPDDRRAGTA